MGNVLSTACLPCMHCIGFTASGVARGSAAAAVHSWHGVVAAGSCFAQCQSTAASAFPFSWVLVLLGWIFVFYCLGMWIAGLSLLVPFYAISHFFEAGWDGFTGFFEGIGHWFAGIFEEVANWFSGIFGGHDANSNSTNPLNVSDANDNGIAIFSFSTEGVASTDPKLNQSFYLIT